MKTVLITGSTKGIGYAIAKKFAINDYNVVLNYANDDENALLAYDLLKQYNVTLIKADISNEQEVIKLLDKVIEIYGNVDCVVNNAGIAIDTILEEKTVENFKKILDVNLIGPFLISKYFGKYMYENRMGNIINISSTNAIDTYYPESMDYDASKAGLNVLTKNFAKEFAPYVRSNAIACGWVNTSMNAIMDNEYKENEINKILLKRFAEPEEIAEVVYFVNETTYINGSIINVDGGK